MHKSLNIRLYPTVKQKILLDRYMDAYRFAYNLCLEYKKTLWRDYNINITGFSMEKELRQIRNNTEWLKTFKAEIIARAALNVDISFQNFFKGSGYPKFKSKKGKQSFSSRENISITHKHIKFSKNLIKFKTSESYKKALSKYKIKNATFKKNSSGEYFASLMLDIKESANRRVQSNTIGIDLGIKDLIVTSENEKYTNPKFLINSHYKLLKLQRKFSKTKKGGSNRNKLRVRIAKTYQKCTYQKEHYYHQITNKIIRDNQTLIVEDLSVKNMLLNHKLARNISDVSWGLIIKQLSYKAKLYGCNLIKVNKFYPSSKKCSDCGSVKEVLLLSERTYNCECCGLSMDRDLNAAINIRNAGMKIPVVPMEGVGYEPDEVGSN